MIPHVRDYQFRPHDRLRLCPVEYETGTDQRLKGDGIHRESTRKKMQRCIDMSSVMAAEMDIGRKVRTVVMGGDHRRDISRIEGNGFGERPGDVNDLHGRPLQAIHTGR